MRRLKRIITMLPLLFLTGCGFSLLDLALVLGAGGAAAVALSDRDDHDGPESSTDFVGITAEVGPPPDTTTGTNTPLISNLFGPASVYQGEKTKFTFDFIDADGDVKEAIFNLDYEERYYIIESPTAQTSGTITVTISLVMNFAVGSYAFRFALRDDARNISNYLETTVDVIRNSKPEQTAGPAPADGATGVPVTTALAWEPACRATSYNVYFGASQPPGLLCEGLTDTTHSPPGLPEYNTRYYWRVNAVNVMGVTTGILWSFETEAEPVGPPDKVTGPAPTDGQTNVAVDTNISWNASTGATSYTVYFGTSDPPELSCEGFVGTTYNPGSLQHNTTYHWQIDAKNDKGTTVGDQWAFRTIIEKPTAASNPTPANGATDVAIDQELSWSAAARADGYYVHFGKTTPPPYAGVETDNTHDPGMLDYDTMYYWKVIRGQSRSRRRTRRRIQRPPITKTMFP
jgi:hypothetical protein